MSARRRLLAWLYETIRPLVVRGIDRNEDFVCVACGRPVLRRVLYCSRRCADAVPT